MKACASCAHRRILHKERRGRCNAQYSDGHYLCERENQAICEIYGCGIGIKQQDQALAQQNIQTIKYRNLVIDLGNGVKTNAQLTYPALGKGPFPGVLLIHGSGVLK
jgi:hypothetical protein